MLIPQKSHDPYEEGFYKTTGTANRGEKGCQRPLMSRQLSAVSYEQKKGEKDFAHTARIFRFAES